MTIEEIDRTVLRQIRLKNQECFVPDLYKELSSIERSEISASIWRLFDMGDIDITTEKRVKPV